MAVATGASLQSVRFDAANVPYGTYELSVIANGISSHVIDFCHRRHEQRCGCGKTEGCCCRGADPCCREEVAMDPQFIRLNQQLKGAFKVHCDDSARRLLVNHRLGSQRKAGRRTRLNRRRPTEKRRRRDRDAWPRAG
jgi:hypothetical protein